MSTPVRDCCPVELPQRRQFARLLRTIVADSTTEEDDTPKRISSFMKMARIRHTTTLKKFDRRRTVVQREREREKLNALAIVDKRDLFSPFNADELFVLELTVVALTEEKHQMENDTTIDVWVRMVLSKHNITRSSTTNDENGAPLPQTIHSRVRNTEISSRSAASSSETKLLRVSCSFMPKTSFLIDDCGKRHTYYA